MADCQEMLKPDESVFASRDSEKYEVFEGLLYLEDSSSNRRKTCSNCQRPQSVCICNALPSCPISINTTIIILQHPNEECRRLTTVPILQKCLSNDKLHIIKGKRFNIDRFPVLKDALMSDSSVLLYPGKAVDLESLSPCPIGKDDNSALIVLDGTWSEVRSMYTQNAHLWKIKQIEISTEVSSSYIIRTQPTRFSLSTLESVAHTLSWLEGNPEIFHKLLLPLNELCKHQLNHGAVHHFSKDDPRYMPRKFSRKTVFS